MPRLPNRLDGADIEFVARVLDRHFGWWNWRLSARFRAASLGSVWLLILGSPVLGTLLIPLAAIRFVGGTAQLVLNNWLGRRHPIERRDWGDWALLGITLLGSMAAAELSGLTGSQSTLLFIPMALPFSAIQIRMCRRSERAHARAAQPVPAPLPLPFERPQRQAA
jgi:hypothetical protein